MKPLRLTDHAVERIGARFRMTPGAFRRRLKKLLETVPDDERRQVIRRWGDLEVVMCERTGEVITAYRVGHKPVEPRQSDD